MARWLRVTDFLDLFQEQGNHEGPICDGKPNPIADSGLWVSVSMGYDKLISLLEMPVFSEANSDRGHQGVQQVILKTPLKKFEQQLWSVTTAAREDTYIQIDNDENEQQLWSVTAAATEPQIPISILIAYAYKDKRRVEEIEQIVRILSMQDQKIVYQMCEVATNMEWQAGNQLDTCDLVLLFVTRNFLETKFCYSAELKRAVQKHMKREVRVLPIHYDKRATPLLPGTPFCGLVMTPAGGKAVTGWSDRDEAMKNVTIDIQEAVKYVEGRR